MSKREKDEVPGATPLRDAPLSPMPTQRPEPGMPPIPGRTGAAGTPSKGPGLDEPGKVDQAARQGFGRQRVEPQDTPPADVRDNDNIAGEKDFELQPPPERAGPG
jgi:hypothetical protein